MAASCALLLRLVQVTMAEGTGRLRASSTRPWTLLPSRGCWPSAAVSASSPASSNQAARRLLALVFVTPVVVVFVVVAVFFLVVLVFVLIILVEILVVLDVVVFEVFILIAAQALQLERVYVDHFHAHSTPITVQHAALLQLIFVQVHACFASGAIHHCVLPAQVGLPLPLPTIKIHRFRAERRRDAKNANGGGGTGSDSGMAGAGRRRPAEGGRGRGSAAGGGLSGHCIARPSASPRRAPAADSELALAGAHQGSGQYPDRVWDAGFDLRLPSRRSRRSGFDHREHGHPRRGARPQVDRLTV